MPDEENPKWKLNILVSQEHMKPYVRLRTWKGEPVVKVKDLSSPTLWDFTDFYLTGDFFRFVLPDYYMCIVITFFSNYLKQIKPVCVYTKLCDSLLCEHVYNEGQVQ